MIVSDGFGKTLSDQTLEAFWHSISHAKPLGVGLNCTLRPKSLEQHVFKLSTIIGKPIWVYPDADFPNKKGKYTQTADDFVEQIKNTKTCMCVRRLLWCHSWTYIQSWLKFKLPNKPVKATDDNIETNFSVLEWVRVDEN